MHMKAELMIIALLLAAFGCSEKKRIHDSVKTSGDTPPLVLLCQDIDYSDTAALHSEAFMKQTMTDIVKMMSVSDSASTARGLRIFFSGLDGDSIAISEASRLAQLYLGNPASPVRDDDLYIRFLKSLLASEGIPESIRIQNEERMRKASLNRQGTIATDFSYIDRNGTRGTLHRFDAPQTLLIFYDPECTHCSDILSELAEDPGINGAIAQGQLSVLAIYAEGKRDVWEKTKAGMPADWNVGYDLTGILDEDLYDLPAMPTLYLLDEAHRVLLKDPEPTLLMHQY